MAPLIGSDELVYAVPLDISCSFFGVAPGAIMMVEHPEGIIPIQPRCWLEPIEDEE